MKDPKKMTPRQLGEGIAVMLELCAFYEPFLEWPADQPDKVEGKYHEIWLRHEHKLRGLQTSMKEVLRAQSSHHRKNGRRCRTYR
jgi:hypothetical protein